MQIELSVNITKVNYSKWENVQKDFHRRKGKAAICWHSNGQKEYESDFMGGERHNLEGVAYTRWHDNGQKWWEDYWINGNYLTKEEWKE